MLGLTVHYQFVTRYVMNNSAACTKEIARYQLIGLAKNNHIQVDFFYRHLPAQFCRWMSTVTDGLRIAFFGAMVVMTLQMRLKIGNRTRMTVVDLPINIVYGVCLLGFAAMLLRSVQVALTHYRRGFSVLERPESSLLDR